MADRPGACFGRQRRLPNGAQYRAVLRRGVRMEGPLFLLVAAPNDRGHCRLGLTVGRRVGTAVERNRAKRVLRESFRRTMAEGRDALDLVLIPKRDIVRRSQAEVDREYRESLRRLLSRTARHRGPAAPAAG